MEQHANDAAPCASGRFQVISRNISEENTFLDTKTKEYTVLRQTPREFTVKTASEAQVRQMLTGNLSVIILLQTLVSEVPKLRHISRF